MPKPAPREVIVQNSALITPNMLRITLGGPGLKGFPADQGSAYIKLLLPGSSGKPTMRTYTVRAQREHASEIDVDFMLHEPSRSNGTAAIGPAVAWARNAKRGDSVTIAGPGGKKLLDFSADWFFLAGDMTALPAISVNLEQLPDSAKGYAVVEILHQDDAQTFELPENFDLHWVINPHPGTENTLLADRVREMPWLPGTPSVWGASEFQSMRALRHYFKQQRKLDKRTLYVSSYWKRGISEEQHKVLKSEDAALNPD